MQCTALWSYNGECEWCISQDSGVRSLSRVTPTSLSLLPTRLALEVNGKYHIVRTSSSSCFLHLTRCLFLLYTALACFPWPQHPHRAELSPANDRQVIENCSRISADLHVGYTVITRLIGNTCGKSTSTIVISKNFLLSLRWQQRFNRPIKCDISNVIND